MITAKLLQILQELEVRPMINIFQSKRKKMIEEINELLDEKDISEMAEFVLKLAKIKLEQGKDAEIVETYLSSKFFTLSITVGQRLTDNEVKYLHTLQRRTGPGRQGVQNPTNSFKSSKDLIDFLSKWGWDGYEEGGV